MAKVIKNQWQLGNIVRAREFTTPKGLFNQIRPLGVTISQKRPNLIFSANTMTMIDHGG